MKEDCIAGSEAEQQAGQQRKREVEAEHPPVQIDREVEVKCVSVTKSKIECCRSGGCSSTARPSARRARLNAPPEAASTRLSVMSWRSKRFRKRRALNARQTPVSEPFRAPIAGWPHSRRQSAAPVRQQSAEAGTRFSAPDQPWRLAGRQQRHLRIFSHRIFRVGIFLFNLPTEPLHISLCLREGNAVLQAGDDLEPVIVRVSQDGGNKLGAAPIGNQKSAVPL